MAAPKLLFLDCDSTLSAIEGVDELARLRGPACFKQIEEMTNAAMDGRVPIDDVFARRLDIIRPSLAECAEIGRRYVERVEPTARTVITNAKRQGWTPIILSAGYTQAIAPLAEYLAIAHVEAVRLDFDAAGQYTGFDRDYPTTRNGGKPKRIMQLQMELKPQRAIMVGDGISDLEAASVVDLFVGFGGYVQRSKVRTAAPVFISSLSELVAHLS
ncbi:MAG: HAD-IB family phosphatase [Opitutaceae bacterium]|nr:HAD-IB family phosphatase [Opitutaceae bacterium]